MARAYRSDVIHKYQDEIEVVGKRVDYQGSHLVKCPVEGCEVQYGITEQLLAENERMEEMLLDTLKKCHPNHVEEIVAIEENL